LALLRESDGLDPHRPRPGALSGEAPGRRVLPLTPDIRWLGEREEDVLDLDRALSRLEGIDSRKAKIVELPTHSARR
jgi:hypothetical protein